MCHAQWFLMESTSSAPLLREDLGGKKVKRMKVRIPPSSPLEPGQSVYVVTPEGLQLLTTVTRKKVEKGEEVFYIKYTIEDGKAVPVEEEEKNHSYRLSEFTSPVSGKVLSEEGGEGGEGKGEGGALGEVGGGGIGVGGGRRGCDEEAQFEADLQRALEESRRGMEMGGAGGAGGGGEEGERVEDKEEEGVSQVCEVKDETDGGVEEDKPEIEFEKVEEEERESEEENVKIEKTEEKEVEDEKKEGKVDLQEVENPPPLLPPSPPESPENAPQHFNIATSDSEAEEEEGRGSKEERKKKEEEVSTPFPLLSQDPCSSSPLLPAQDSWDIYDYFAKDFTSSPPPQPAKEKEKKKKPWEWAVPWNWGEEEEKEKEEEVRRGPNREELFKRISENQIDLDLPGFGKEKKVEKEGERLGLTEEEELAIALEESKREAEKEENKKENTSLLSREEREKAEKEELEKALQLSKLHHEEKKGEQPGVHLPFQEIHAMGLYLETQGTGSASCGVHALNNLMQENVFKIADLQQAEVELGRLIRRGGSFLGEEEVEREESPSHWGEGASRTGMFDVEALRIAGRKGGLEIIDIPPQAEFENGWVHFYAEEGRRREGWVLGKEGEGEVDGGTFCEVLEGLRGEEEGEKIASLLDLPSVLKQKKKRTFSFSPSPRRRGGEKREEGGEGKEERREKEEEEEEKEKKDKVIEDEEEVKEEKEEYECLEDGGNDDGNNEKKDDKTEVNEQGKEMKEGEKGGEEGKDAVEKPKSEKKEKVEKEGEVKAEVGMKENVNQEELIAKEDNPSSQPSTSFPSEFSPLSLLLSPLLQPSLLGFLVYQRIPGKPLHYYVLLRREGGGGEEGKEGREGREGEEGKDKEELNSRPGWVKLDSLGGHEEDKLIRFLSDDDFKNFYLKNSENFSSWLLRWYPVIDRKKAIENVKTILKCSEKVAEKLLKNGGVGRGLPEWSSSFIFVEIFEKIRELNRKFRKMYAQNFILKNENLEEDWKMFFSKMKELERDPATFFSIFFKVKILKISDYEIEKAANCLLLISKIENFEHKNDKRGKEDVLLKSLINILDRSEGEVEKAEKVLFLASKIEKNNLKNQEKNEKNPEINTEKNEILPSSPSLEEALKNLKVCNWDLEKAEKVEIIFSLPLSDC